MEREICLEIDQKFKITGVDQQQKVMLSSSFVLDLRQGLKQIPSHFPMKIHRDWKREFFSCWYIIDTSERQILQLFNHNNDNNNERFDHIPLTTVDSMVPEDFNKIPSFLFKQLQGFELIFLISIECLSFSQNEILQIFEINSKNNRKFLDGGFNGYCKNSVQVFGEGRSKWY
jgi:hypothetical protein